jgi:DNA-binding transcriptional LysR family regulator
MATFANQLAERFPLSIVDVEIEFPLVDVYLLWHDRAHYAQEGRWFRNQILSATQDALGKAFRASPFEP